jgi:hypothetical protein
MVVVRAVFSGTPMDPADARRLVRTQLEGRADPDALDMLLIAISEVVTNAVLHGRTDVSMCVDWDDSVAHVEIADGNTRVPQVDSVPTDAVSGRGMVVLEHLSSRWESVVNDNGKVVRFDVPVPADGRG